MGFAPTWLRQVSPPASHDHFNHCVHAVFTQTVYASFATSFPKVQQAVRRRPPQYAQTRDLLTLKVVAESRVRCATSVPILVFLGLSVLDSGPMYATDRRQTASLLNAPPRGRGHNNLRYRYHDHSYEFPDFFGRRIVLTRTIDNTTDQLSPLPPHFNHCMHVRT